MSKPEDAQTVLVEKKPVKSNFTNFEKEFITTLVKKYSNILESRRNDAVMCREKNATWETLTEEFNNFDPKIQKRTPKQLKKCWENLKTRAKKASYGLKPDEPYTDDIDACETILDHQPQVADLIAMQLKPASNDIKPSINEKLWSAIKGEMTCSTEEKILNATSPGSPNNEASTCSNDTSMAGSHSPTSTTQTPKTSLPFKILPIPKNPILRQTLSSNYQQYHLQMLQEEEQKLKNQLLKRKIEVLELEHCATMALLESKREYLDLKKQRLLRDDHQCVDSD